MSLTSRDIEEIEQKPYREPALLGFLVSLVRVFMRFTPLSKAIAESVGGLSGRIFHCWEHREYEKAAQLAIHALGKYRHKKSKFMPSMDHHHWWSFMKLAVDSAKRVENKELRDKLIEYADTGMQPYEGYHVAYSYLEFSRWRYYGDKYDDAIKYAEIAASADSTWAEPDFLLGWYGLLLGKGGAEEHLNSAVEKDHRLIFRIANNEICKQYPFIINKLKSKYSDIINDKKA